MNMKQQFRLRAALTAATLAITVGCMAQTKIEAKTDMQSEQSTGAEMPSSVEIITGCVDTIGGWSVGVMGVTGTGSDKKAYLSVAAYASGVAAEFTMQAAEHTLIPVGDGLHQVLWISPGVPQQAGIGISSVPSRQQPSTPGLVSVYLVADGRLLVNGPQIDGASNIQVAAWYTNKLLASVDVKWMSAQYAEKDTDPKDIRHAHLTVGSRLDIDGQVLTVRAIEPQTAEHPAWVRFEMASPPSR
jgi:hypothetical protein